MVWVVTPEQYLNLEQVKKLRASAKTGAEEASQTGGWHGVRDWMMIDLALSSGLRASELASLQVGDIILDQANPTVVVRRGKGGKMRIVKVGDALIQHLREYLEYREAAGRGNSPWLLPSQRGKWTRHGVGRAFKLLARQAGLPERFSIHSLRHTFLVLLDAEPAVLPIDSFDEGLGDAGDSPEDHEVAVTEVGEDNRSTANPIAGALLEGPPRSPPAALWQPSGSPLAASRQPPG